MNGKEMEKAMAGAKWMQGAVKHPGALRATAKRMGMIKGDQMLTPSILSELAKSKNPTTRRRATLAQTFAKYRGK